MEKIKLEITPQELADWRHLVSIAVWIRSEQIHGEDAAYLTIQPQQLNSTVPPVGLSNELLSMGRAMKDFDVGQTVWRQMTELLKPFKADKLLPSWHKPEDLRGAEY